MHKDYISLGKSISHSKKPCCLRTQLISPQSTTKPENQVNYASARMTTSSSWTLTMAGAGART